MVRQLVLGGYAPLLARPAARRRGRDPRRLPAAQRRQRRRQEFAARGTRPCGFSVRRRRHRAARGAIRSGLAGTARDQHQERQLARGRQPVPRARGRADHPASAGGPCAILWPNSRAVAVGSAGYPAAGVLFPRYVKDAPAELTRLDPARSLALLGEGGSILPTSDCRTCGIPRMVGAAPSVPALLRQTRRSGRGGARSHRRARRSPQRRCATPRVRILSAASHRSLGRLRRLWVTDPATAGRSSPPPVPRGDDDLNSRNLQAAQARSSA